MSVTETIFSLILPETCRVCQRILKKSKNICSECDQKIEMICSSHCTVCGLPFDFHQNINHPCKHCIEKPPPFDSHRSCALYGEPVNYLVHRFKYEAGFDLLGLFSDWMNKVNGEMLKEADYLIPVPLSHSRLKQRTYNQSLLLAKVISSQTGIPVLPHSLRKVRETVPQTGLKREERIKNLRGAFDWRDSSISIKGKKIILIDDVYSTGSTLSVCSQVLRKQKPRYIGALTLAFNRGV